MTILKSAMLGTAAAIVALGIAGGAAYAQTDSPATGQAGSQVQQDMGASGQAGGAGTAMRGQAGASGETQTQAQSGTQAQGEGDTQAQGGMQAQGETDTQAQGESSTQAQGKTGTQAEGETGTQAQSGAQADSEAKAKVALDQTQVTEIKQYFTENKPDVDSVEVSSVNVSVGVAVPSSVALHPLPSTIVVNVPSDCPLEFFVWGTDIVIVDSCTQLVLEIIPDVA